MAFILTEDSGERQSFITAFFLNQNIHSLSLNSDPVAFTSINKKGTDKNGRDKYEC